jgi:hypothetical protein
MRARILLLLTSLFMAEIAAGATILVRKDGTGDYSVLHTAVNAAADGDTILIGPGEFTETRSVQIPGWPFDVLTHGDVLVRRLTIIGAGEGVTVIGPVSLPSDGALGHHGLSMMRMDHELYISDLTIRSSGLFFEGSFTVQRCELRNSSVIWATLTGTSNLIRDCRFSGQDTGGIVAWPSDSGLEFEDCQFNGAYALVCNSDVSFRRCRFDGGTFAVRIIDGERCQILDCDITNVSWGISTVLDWPPYQCEIHSSRIAGVYAALSIDDRTSATVENSVLTGGSDSVVYAHDADAITIHGCDFVKGAGPVFRCERSAALGPVTYDVTNNYWGTSDESQIREWIIDSNDDASIFATVQYSPFSGQSVPTETTSWGDVKVLFR